MKNKNVLLFSIAALLSSSTLIAQAPQNWKTNGNSLTAAGKLGTTSAQDVNFISNNVSRMSLKSSGNLRMNSDQTSILFANPGATPKPMMFIYESGSINTARMVMAYSPFFPNYGLKYNGFDKFDFTDGLSTALNVDLTNSRIGVGTNLPKTRLHVVNGSSGTSPIINTTFTLENSTNNYISVLAPNSAESGILFGNPANIASGGIIYNSSFTGTSSNGLQFRTNGNIPRMVLSKDGFLNVGPGLNDDYRIRLDHSSALGFDIANSSKNTDWEFFASTSGLNLFVDGGIGGAKGIFNRTTGIYSALSDERSKTNIKPMVNVLEKISQLKPSSYQFKEAKDKQEYDGFIAQQVMKVFPNLVTHNVEPERKVDQYLLNYNGFGVIAIKGIQELMKQNEEKDVKIESLQKQIDELKEIVLKDNKSNAATSATIKTSLTDASLEQNVPNPVTNSTSIGYNIPSIFSSAQIIITDKSGRTIKQLNIATAGKGVVNVDASALSPGAYNYSLTVNGKMISTKQMIVTK